MNRRDTILVAVLINMGLLVVLFVGALKPKSVSETLSQKVALKSNTPKEAIEKEPSNASFDQVDHILSQYIVNESQSTKKNSPKKEPQKVVAETKKEVKLYEVIVKQGDFLEKIARRANTTVDEVMRINKLKDTRLQIGQILYVPKNTNASDYMSKAIEPRYYTVKNGDNPWTIAIKNKIRVEELLRLNNLDESKAKKLKPGDRLRIE